MKMLLRIVAVGTALAYAGVAAKAQTVFDASALDDAGLKTLAGREDVAQSAQSNSNATVTRNSIGANSVTGEARIEGQAFQNLSGLSLVNINTGNNVAMNSSMNVNIAINRVP